LIFVYTRLELNLALFVAGHKGDEHREKVLRKIQEEESFKKKLVLLLRAVQKQFPEDADCLDIWEGWLNKAEKLRVTRNSLVHGRWGINEHVGEIINVHGLPTSTPQHETRYTLVQLEAVVLEAEATASVFNELYSGRWRKSRRKSFYGPNSGESKCA
jgi:hypothetical protein